MKKPDIKDFYTETCVDYYAYSMHLAAYWESVARECSLRLEQLGEIWKDDYGQWHVWRNAGEVILEE